MFELLHHFVVHSKPSVAVLVPEKPDNQAVWKFSDPIKSTCLFACKYSAFYVTKRDVRLFAPLSIHSAMT